MLAQLHRTGLERAAEDGNGKVRIARTAHEDIDGREVALGPGVNADVGLRQHDHARYAAALTELMQMRVQNGCARRTRGITERRFRTCGIGKVAGVPKIQQQMTASVAKAVFVDEIIGPNLHVAAHHSTGNDFTGNDITGNADSNLVFTAAVLQHFVLFPHS